MNKADDARDAAAFALDLLVSEDRPTEEIIALSAAEYDLNPSVVAAWLARSFPDSESLMAWREERRLAARNRAARQAELIEVEAAAKEWARGVWKNCEPDGHRLWPYCCNRFLEANGIKNPDHRKAAHRIFAEVGTAFAAARDQYRKSMLNGAAE
jgi:hypothetical protein